jgi:hypothetical protein
MTVKLPRREAPLSRRGVIGALVAGAALAPGRGGSSTHLFASRFPEGQMSRNQRRQVGR